MFNDVFGDDNITVNDETTAKGDSICTKNCTKKFMSENGIDFLDLHDHLDEIGINQETDFIDLYHLNHGGAEKCTDYLVDNIKMFS